MKVYCTVKPIIIALLLFSRIGDDNMYITAIDLFKIA